MRSSNTRESEVAAVARLEVMIAATAVNRRMNFCMGRVGGKTKRLGGGCDERRGLLQLCARAQSQAIRRIRREPRRRRRRPLPPRPLRKEVLRAERNVRRKSR